jgi:hypothetical protein
MTYSPKYIVYIAVCNYLSEEELHLLKEDIGKMENKNSKIFLGIIKKHFDIERMRLKPFIWQDVWIYNYLKYDAFKRTKVIAKYEQEIILPQKNLMNELKDILNKIELE